jgi:hypothetical protein
MEKRKYSYLVISHQNYHFDFTHKYSEVKIKKILQFLSDSIFVVEGGQSSISLMEFPWLRIVFVCLFWVSRAIFQLSGNCHHYRWQGCEFRPYAKHLRLLAVRVLLRDTRTATRDLRLKVISKRPVILTSECRGLGKGVITTYFRRFRFDTAGPSRARTHDLPDAKRESYH